MTPENRNECGGEQKTGDALDHVALQKRGSEWRRRTMRSPGQSSQSFRSDVGTLQALVIGCERKHMQWARLQANVDCQLRRGGWYRVLRMASVEAVLDVNSGPVPVLIPFLEISNTPPRRWTVVPRPANAVNMPPTWGSEYAVCPNCRHRQPLAGHAKTLTCE